MHSDTFAYLAFPKLLIHHALTPFDFLLFLQLDPWYFGSLGVFHFLFLLYQNCVLLPASVAWILSFVVYSASSSVWLVCVSMYRWLSLFHLGLRILSFQIECIHSCSCKLILYGLVWFAISSLSSNASRQIPSPSWKLHKVSQRLSRNLKRWNFQRQESQKTSLNNEAHWQLGGRSTFITNARFPHVLLEFIDKYSSTSWPWTLLLKSEFLDIFSRCYSITACYCFFSWWLPLLSISTDHPGWNVKFRVYQGCTCLSTLYGISLRTYLL